MKHNLNKSYLLGLSLLSSFLVIGFINVTNGSDGVTIKGSPSSFTKIEHRTRLHSLYLWNNKSLTGAGMNVFTGRNNLDVVNGMFIGSGGSASGTGFVGGGLGNEIDGRNTGIGGGNNNKAKFDDSFIGGGNKNSIRGAGSVIVGGDEDWAFNDSVAVGGKDNIAKGGVVIGGLTNRLDRQTSLVFGNKATAVVDGAFAWNGENTKENSAYIKADSGVRIGDVGGVLKSVPLYVNGSVKVGDSSLGKIGEIKSDSDYGCIRGNDGEIYQTFGRASGGGNLEGGVNPCGSLDSCQFGSVYIQNGDVVKAYTAPYSSSNKCSDLKTITLKCENGELACNGVRPCNKTYYVSCHGVDSSKPIYHKDPSMK